MLFSDVAHRHLFAFAVGDCDTEDAFAQEDPLGVYADLKIMPRNVSLFSRGREYQLLSVHSGWLVISKVLDKGKGRS